jgi:hypothetical protein
MKRLFSIMMICAALAVTVFAQAPKPKPEEVTLPGKERPAPVENPETLPRQYREMKLGMSLEELKAALAADGLFTFRGDRDISVLHPVKGENLVTENLVETSGLSFIRRAYFQLRGDKVFIMGFSLDPEKIDHYSVFTRLRNKYGDPASLNPREAVWETEETRLSLERPLTVKYIDMTVFNEIAEQSKTEAANQVLLREKFINEF